MPINATRMNLINTKKERVLAKKGHSLLKTKQEVLIIELLKLLKESTKGRAQLESAINRAYAITANGIAYTGDFQLETASNYVKEPEYIGVSIKNIMGVKVPEISKNIENRELFERGYSVLSTSAVVDDIYESFIEALDSIIDTAKREAGLRRLAVEIDAVKRRVNALEYKRIPMLNERAKYISMRLDEMDRDSFSALKHIKKRLGERK